MKKKNFIFVLISIALSSCEVDPSLVDDSVNDMEPVSFVKPAHFPDAIYNLQQNPVTTEGFILGRKLFYDPILSKDNSISCGECHQQYSAFAHGDHQFSHGINGLIGTRNSPPLFNLAFQKDFMWDGGVNNLEVQPLLPITNPVEMDEDINNVVAKLDKLPTYRQLFKSAFGDETINSQRVLRALSQFMVMMISANAKYDKVKLGKETFSTAEQSGYDVFVQKCSACHQEPLFTDLSFRNNGLDLFPKDPGRAMITFDPADSGKVKVPSLRNLKYTYPYMHDGRFQNLQEVIMHYTAGVKPCATLDPLLSNGITLSNTEIDDLLTFLKTLDDVDFTKDKKLSEYQ